MVYMTEQSKQPAHLFGLDDVVLPDDAGVHAAGLARILNRIPAGWGRWISCGPGWYARLVELDKEIATILPEYEVHQVKEKFGTLRYYIGLPIIQPACCVAMDATRPHPGPVHPRYLKDDTRTALQQYELDEWCYMVHRPHFTSAEHAEGERQLEPVIAKRNELLQLAEAYIRAAEEDLSHVCEECAAPGKLRTLGWYKTLCDECAVSLGYVSPDAPPTE